MGYGIQEPSAKSHPAKVSCSEKKSASEDFFDLTKNLHQENCCNPLKTRQENPSVATKTASGVHYCNIACSPIQPGGVEFFPPKIKVQNASCQSRCHYKADYGRWLGRDPIEERGGYNLYGFVLNRPLNNWDRYGEIIVLAPAVPYIIAGLSAAGGYLGLDRAVNQDSSVLSNFGNAANNLSNNLSASTSSSSDYMSLGEMWDYFWGDSSNPSQGGTGLTAGELGIEIPASPVSCNGGSCLPSPLPTFNEGFGVNLTSSQIAALLGALANMPLDRGAEEWGCRNGENPSDARRRAHDMKHSDPFATTTGDYRVDPNTGDIFDPEGEVIGNLSE